jgi:hypothetical protein
MEDSQFADIEPFEFTKSNDAFGSVVGFFLYELVIIYGPLIAILPAFLYFF